MKQNSDIGITGYQEYEKIGTAFMRPVTDIEIILGAKGLISTGVSISKTDKNNGSPKHGDMIARNPCKSKDMWLVAKQYFEENYVLKDK